MCLVLLLFSGCCSASRRAVPMRNQRIASLCVDWAGFGTRRRIGLSSKRRSHLSLTWPISTSLGRYWTTRQAEHIWCVPYYDPRPR